MENEGVMLKELKTSAKRSTYQLQYPVIVRYVRQQISVYDRSVEVYARKLCSWDTRDIGQFSKATSELFLNAVLNVQLQQALSAYYSEVEKNITQNDERKLKTCFDDNVENNFFRQWLLENIKLDSIMESAKEQLECCDFPFLEKGILLTLFNIYNSTKILDFLEFCNYVIINPECCHIKPENEEKVVQYFSALSRSITLIKETLSVVCKKKGLSCVEKKSVELKSYTEARDDFRDYAVWVQESKLEPPCLNDFQDLFSSDFSGNSEIDLKTSDDYDFEVRLKRHGKCYLAESPDPRPKPKPDSMLKKFKRTLSRRSSDAPSRSNDPKKQYQS